MNLRASSVMFLAFALGILVILFGVSAYGAQAILGWILRKLRPRLGPGYFLLWILALISVIGGGPYFAWLAMTNQLHASGESEPSRIVELAGAYFVVWIYPVCVFLAAVWLGSIWATLRTPPEFAMRIALSPQQRMNLWKYGAIITALVAGIGGWLYFVFRDV